MKEFYELDLAKLIKYDTHCNWYYIFLLPIRIMQSLIVYKRNAASVLLRHLQFWWICLYQKIIFYDTEKNKTAMLLNFYQ